MSDTPGFDLVAAAQAGDTDAFGELWRRYRPSVHRYVKSKVADAGLAEDLTSEVFLRGWQSIHTVHDEGVDVAGWFFTIARNKVTDHLRRTETRRLFVPRIPVDEHASGIPDQAPNPETVAVDADNRRVLADDLAIFLDRLPDHYQACLRMRFYAQMTGRQMGAALGMDERHVRRLQHRATTRLKHLMGAYQTTAAFAAADHTRTLT